jgi:hypothetical protein
MTAAFVLALATGLPLVGATPAVAKSCVLAGGEATMITEDLARFMANAALENSIKGKGLKPSGAVKMACKPGFANTHCIARQKACK